MGFEAEYTLWSGLFARAGTPERVVKRLREAIRTAVDDPQFKSAMEKLQARVAYLDAPEFAKFWETDAARLTQAVRRMGQLE